MKRTFIYISVLFLIFINPVGAAKVKGSTSNIDITYFSSNKLDSYRIQKEDEITFIYTYPDGKQNTYTRLQIFPNGKMIIPGVGEVEVFNKTSLDLKKLIEEVTGEAFKAEVLIFRLPDNISVLGEVRNPGSYTHNNIKTVYDAIAKAGGFTNDAKKSEVTLVRQRVDGTRVSYFINFPKEVFQAYEPGTGVGEDVYVLQEGDLIFVPTNRWFQVGHFALKAFNLATLGVMTGIFTAIISNTLNN